MISTIIISALLLSGAFFSMLASIGVVRFPDIYTRMHAATKAPAFGILLLQTSAAIYFASFYAIAVSLLVIIFIFITAPVASHSIGRVAHMLKIPKWKGTLMDEMDNDPDIEQPGHP